MQFVRATSTAALFLLFGTIVPAYAQQDQQNEKQGKPEKHQGRQQQGARATRTTAAPSGTAATTAGTRTATAEATARAAARTTRSTTAAAAGPTDSATAAATAAGTTFPAGPATTATAPYASSRQSRGNSSGDGYSRAAGGGRVHGSRAVLDGGKASIAPGRSVEAMAVTTFLRPASVSISGVNTGSGCTAAPRSTWGIRASRTAAFRSCSWIPGQNTGQKTGTTPMTFTSIMTTGYYLYNRRYPSVRLAITVVL